MNESNVRLAPLEEATPMGAPIPIRRARRWRSPYENPGAKPCVTVFVTQRAYVRFCAHAGTDLDNEVGGGLVGRWRADPVSGEEFIVVEGVLPARHTRQGSTFLTFTQDTLVALHEELENRFPGKELVGWFHTHPRMGVFLSGYDVWLHEHFFPQPWQVALVIEPHSASGGFFIRQGDGRLDPHRYFGFYELARDGRGRNVIHWNNLKPDEEEKGNVNPPVRSEPASERKSDVNPPARSEPAIEKKGNVNLSARSEPAIEKKGNVNLSARSEPASEKKGNVNPPARSEPAIEKKSNANPPARSESASEKKGNVNLSARSESASEKKVNVNPPARSESASERTEVIK